MDSFNFHFHARKLTELGNNVFHIDILFSLLREIFMTADYDV